MGGGERGGGATERQGQLFCPDAFQSVEDMRERGGRGGGCEVTLVVVVDAQDGWRGRWITP